MQDNEDYNVRLARYIWAILTSQPIILMSWGIDPKTVRTIELGLEFHCQGFKHRGLVRVTLNEGEDLFEVSLIDENGEIDMRIKDLNCTTEEVIDKMERLLNMSEPDSDYLHLIFF